MKTDFRNILVISNENIGDIIMSTAAIALIRTQYPEARITVLTSRPCTGILRDGKIVNETLWDAVPENKLARQLYKLRTILWMRGKKYDACYFFGHPRRKIVQLCKYAGIPVRIVGSHTLPGRVNQGPKRFATHISPVSGAIGSTHVADYYQDIVLGYNPHGQRQKTFIHVPDSTPAPNTPDSAEKTTVAFCFFGSRDNPHRWPPEYFDAVITRLVQRGASLCTVIAPGDRDRTQELITRCGWPVSVRVTEKLENCAAELQRVGLLISINTGQVHMAAALDIPVISLAGPEPSTTYPFSYTGVAVSLGEVCRNCRLDPECLIGADRDAPGYVPACITGLTPDKVWPVIEEMLEGKMPQSRVRLV